MSPWKLGDADDPTVKIEVRLPESMKAWLKERFGDREVSEFIRRLIAREMRREKRALVT